MNADLPPVPKPIVSNKPPRIPHCYYCGDGRAVPLIVGLPELDGCIFCSLICAAKCGIKAFRESSVSWCDAHETWSAYNGNCIQCVEERNREYLAKHGQELAANGGKVVLHG